LYFVVVHFGCQLKPNAIPFLGNYSGMDWTLCNQLCTGQEQSVFLVGKDTCYCGNDTLINYGPLTNESACDIPCSTHPDQMCGDGSVVDGYYTGKIRCIFVICLTEYFIFYTICHTHNVKLLISDNAMLRLMASNYRPKLTNLANFCCSPISVLGTRTPVRRVV